MEDAEAVILFVGVFFILSNFIFKPIINQIGKIPPFEEFFVGLIESIGFKIFILCLLAFLFILFNVWLHKKLVKNSIKRKERRILIEENREKIEELLNEDLEKLNSDEIKKLIRKLGQISVLDENKNYNLEVEDKLKRARLFLNKRLKDEEIERYESEKRYLLNEIEELKIKKYEQELRIGADEEKIFKKLKADENIVFELDKLNKKEIEVLTKRGFEKTNEYDPILKKNLNFLVKKVLHHSATHTFLVERIKEILKEYVNEFNIEVHETREADVIFEINSKKYAFEVETGSLLSKKGQLKGKIEFLNKRYEKNWYFVVSNRDLAKKYRKFGKTVLRVGVCKIIEKITKS